MIACISWMICLKIDCIEHNASSFVKAYLHTFTSERPFRYILFWRFPMGIQERKIERFVVFHVGVSQPSMSALRGSLRWSDFTKEYTVLIRLVLTPIFQIPFPLRSKIILFWAEQTNSNPQQFRIEYMFPIWYMSSTNKRSIFRSLLIKVYGLWKAFSLSNTLYISLWCIITFYTVYNFGIHSSQSYVTTCGILKQ